MSCFPKVLFWSCACAASEALLRPTPHDIGLCGCPEATFLALVTSSFQDTAGACCWPLVGIWCMERAAVASAPSNVLFRPSSMLALCSSSGCLLMWRASAAAIEVCPGGTAPPRGLSRLCRLMLPSVWGGCCERSALTLRLKGGTEMCQVPIAFPGSLLGLRGRPAATSLSLLVPAAAGAYMRNSASAKLCVKIVFQRMPQ